MGYDQYIAPNDCSCRTYFCCFPLALADIRPWPLVPFFQISLKNSDNTIQYISGLSRAHFPTTFLEVVVYFLSLSTGLAVHRSVTGAQQQSSEG